METESAVREKTETPNPEQYRAIAVLPFKDMSETGDQAWFAEGIAEELLHVLSNVGGLHVKARTSSFAFKDTGKTIAEIAQVLGVQAVLEGSVRRSGDRVRVTAQLIDASNGYHVWSGSYERQLTDIFQLQDELARSLVQALRIPLGADESRVLVAEQTSKPEAYNALIRGRTLLNWGSSENLDQSISYFEKAVSADPDYAAAWGYLAWARSGAVFFRPTGEMSASAAEAYQRALELDPHQGEALAAKAWMTELLLRDWRAANKLYLQAMASADNTTAMLAYGMYFLAPVDQLPEALRVLRMVEQRDPLHPTYKATLAYFLLTSGDAEAAIQKAREALELNPGHFFALVALIDAYNVSGNSSAAEAVLRSLPKDLLQHPRLRVRTALCDVARGDYDSARKTYDDLMGNRIPYGNIMLAQLALSLGEIDQAIDHMEWEVQQHSWNSIFVRILFRDQDVVKNNPRYLALLKNVGLDDTSVTELHRKLAFE